MDRKFTALRNSERVKAMRHVVRAAREYDEDIEDAQRFLKQDLILHFDPTSRLFPLICEWSLLMCAMVIRGDLPKDEFTTGRV